MSSNQSPKQSSLHQKPIQEILNLPLLSQAKSKEISQKNQINPDKRPLNHPLIKSNSKIEKPFSHPLINQKPEETQKKKQNPLENSEPENLEEKEITDEKALTAVLSKKGNGRFTKGTWKPDEDSQLVNLVSKFGPQNWTRIAEFIPLRSGKQCRERWHNHLNPNINKQKWSLQEDKILIEAHKKYFFF